MCGGRRRHQHGANLHVGHTGQRVVVLDNRVSGSGRPQLAVFGLLWSVDCLSTTSCVAVGWDNSATSQAIYTVGSESGGQWTWSESVDAPTDSLGGAIFTGVRCSTLASCVTVGGDANGQGVVSVAAVPPSAPKASELPSPKTHHRSSIGARTRTAEATSLATPLMN